MRRILAALAVAAAFCFAAGAASADDSTTGTIRMVVGTPAGGAVDIYARVIADRMKKDLGQNIIVENRPGANGNISAHAVAHAPADGLTIWVGTQSMTEINPSAFSHLSWKPSDFTPLIKGVEAPLILVTHPSVPAKNLKDLVAWIKKNKGHVSFASFSPGTPSHFLGFQMNQTFGLDMTHVPYRGSAPQTTALLAGTVPLGFDQIATTLQYIKAGKLNAIATTGAKRFRLTASVPTFQELGHPEFNATIWFGLFVRSGTPKPVSERLLKAAIAAHKDAAVRKKLEAVGFDVPGLTGPAFSKEISTQIERWRKLIVASGFKAG
ncbi:MAG TPA: tripartite tricarboxylate transporter substrate binding protein [Pseudolabrys sp.]|nr:tripartite tricarboxylate transporter substrate binding protein [Pseudolabrys sp.]